MSEKTSDIEYVRTLRKEMVGAAGRCGQETTLRQRWRTRSRAAPGGRSSAWIVVASLVMTAGVVAVSVVLLEPSDRTRTSSTVTSAAPDVNPGATDNGGGAARTWQRIESQAQGGAVREVEHFDSLTQMTESADVVVRGRVISTQPGRLVGKEDQQGGGAARYLNVNVEVEQDLRGTIVTDSPGTLAIEFGPYDLESNLAVEGGKLLGDEALFFLRLKGSAIPGVAPEPDPEEMALGLYRVVSSQGLFVNNGGLAVAVWAERGSFTDQLNDVSFEELVERTSALSR